MVAQRPELEHHFDDPPQLRQHLKMPLRETKLAANVTLCAFRPIG
jgi:hypothetical protein